MRKKAVPVIRFGRGIPGPIRFFGIGEDDANAAVFPFAIAPYVEIAFNGSNWSKSRALKPRMLVGGVIDHQFNHDLHIPLMCRIEKRLEIVERAVVGMNI